MKLKTNIVFSIPKLCPKCEQKLHHVNAVDTKAKLYMIFCLNPKCRYCKDYYFKFNGEM